MTNNITIKEYFKEIETYEYSKECFDLTKEACEFNLFTLYLENYRYIEECKEYDEEIHESVMFFEKGNDRIIKNQKPTFLRRLWNGIFKIIKWFSRPFLVIKAYFDRLIFNFKTRKLTPEEKSALLKNINDSRNVKNIIDKWEENQPDWFYNIFNGPKPNGSSNPSTKKFQNLNLNKKYRIFVNNLISFTEDPWYIVPEFMEKIIEFNKMFATKFLEFLDRMESNNGKIDIKEISDFTNFISSILEDVRNLENRKKVFKNHDEIKEYLWKDILETQRKIGRLTHRMEDILKNIDPNITECSALNKLFQTLVQLQDEYSSTLWADATMNEAYSRRLAEIIVPKWLDELLNAVK